MDFNRSLRQLRTVEKKKKKLSAVMLLALLAPSGCLLYSGRVDLQVCRLYLAGGVLLVCAVTSDLAARKVRSLWSYILICVLGDRIRKYEHTPNNIKASYMIRIHIRLPCFLFLIGSMSNVPFPMIPRIICYLSIAFSISCSIICLFATP